MQNKPFLFCTVFFFLCGSSFSQENIDSFIDDSYWYQKYLPLENISDYSALRNTLIHLKENDLEGIDSISNDFAEPIRLLDNKVIENLQKERTRVSPKMSELSERFGENDEVIILAEQFLIFEHDFDTGKFPGDDSCIDKIDELYARLITRLGYAFLPRDPGGHIDEQPDEYLVLAGDYLRKIAVKHYGRENLWRIIWRDEENYRNREFLPNPENPNLILPGARIRIPVYRE
jgi:hypothetical protein